MKKDCCTIYLNGGLNATLDFQDQKNQAQDAVKNGLSLNFEIDLGLFSKLKKPLSNQSQFLSLTLSLKHFKETLWEEFQNDIESVSLYKGSLDFAEDFIFDDEQLINFHNWLAIRSLDVPTHSSDKWLISLFCRDALFDYLHALSLDSIGSVPFCLKLDAKNVNDPLLFALLTHKEVCEPFNLLIESHLSVSDKPPIAICLPCAKTVLKTDYKDLEEIFSFLIEKKIPYRLIPESMLITEWDLVDYLFVLSPHVKMTGKRMLQGFIAAGGTVVTLGDRLNLENEISLPEFTLIQREVEDVNVQAFF